MINKLAKKKKIENNTKVGAEMKPEKLTSESKDNLPNYAKSDPPSYLPNASSPTKTTKSLKLLEEFWKPLKKSETSTPVTISVFPRKIPNIKEPKSKTSNSDKMDTMSKLKS